ncbi:MAG: NAD-dependent epimerase/dehydratase family protein [Anaerolineae bacterium]
MRILVTGATGFIGRTFVPHLVAAGTQVMILVREHYQPGDQLPQELASLRSQFGVVYADLRNYNLTARAVREAQPEYVVHLAAAGVTNPFLSVETALHHNVVGTINLLRACFSLPDAFPPPRQFIIGRTPGEHSAMNVYAASKAAAWDFCRMYARTQDWPIQGAVIFQAYGPGQPKHTLIPAAVDAARAGQEFPMTAGTQERDWIHVSDVAAGLAALLHAELAPGTSIDLGTGQLTSVADVVRMIFELAGRGGRPLVGALPQRPGEEPRQVADSGQTHTLIGWRPSIFLKQGLAMLLAG